MRATFVRPGGGTWTVEARDGSSVVRAAADHAVPGIVGECAPISDDEEELLDCVATDRDPARNRLGCQLSATHALAEETVEVPALQG